MNLQDQTVAALYVQADGIYANRAGVDPWPVKRDARTYEGPHPVVAHPPCQLWVNFASLNYKRYGGEHNRPGNDGGAFASALDSVLAFGGVLEHPAGSNAWKHYCLAPPPKAAKGATVGPGWGKSQEGWVCEVWQSAYGHPARKRTWLFYSGVRPPFELNWNRLPGTHQVGWFDRNKPTLSKKQANATPPLFADALEALARWSRA